MNGPRGQAAFPLHRQGTVRTPRLAVLGTLLGGPYNAVFWVGVVFMGILLPLVIQSRAVTHRIIHTPIAPILVMLGGLALRFVIVSAGQVSHWPRLL